MNTGQAEKVRESTALENIVAQEYQTRSELISISNRLEALVGKLDGSGETKGSEGSTQKANDPCGFVAVVKSVQGSQSAYLDSIRAYVSKLEDII